MTSCPWTETLAGVARKLRVHSNRSSLSRGPGLGCATTEHGYQDAPGASSIDNSVPDWDDPGPRIIVLLAVLSQRV